MHLAEYEMHNKADRRTVADVRGEWTWGVSARGTIPPSNNRAAYLTSR